MSIPPLPDYARNTLIRIHYTARLARFDFTVEVSSPDDAPPGPPTAPPSPQTTSEHPNHV